MLGLNKELEQPKDIPVKIRTGHLLQGLCPQVKTVSLIGMIHAEFEMRYPPRVGLDTHNIQVGVSIKYAAQNHHHDDVLQTAYGDNLVH